MFVENTLFNLPAVMRFTGPFVLGAHMIGITIIQYKKTSRLSEFANHLTVHLAFGCLSEILMGILVMPRVYSPDFLASTHGLLTRLWSLNPLFQIELVISSVGLSGCSLVQLILFRANSVLPPHSRLKLAPRAFKRFLVALFASASAPGLVCGLVAVARSDLRESGARFLASHADFAPLLPFLGHVIMANDDSYAKLSYYLVAFSGLSYSLLGVAGFCSILHTLHGHASKSASSQLKVRTILITLFIQVLPNVLCYSLGCTYVAGTMLSGVRMPCSQVLNDLTMLLLSAHSIFSVVLALGLTPDYRNYLLQFLRRGTEKTVALELNNISTQARSSAAQAAMTRRRSQSVG